MAPLMNKINGVDKMSELAADGGSEEDIPADDDVAGDEKFKLSILNINMFQTDGFADVILWFQTFYYVELSPEK